MHPSSSSVRRPAAIPKAVLGLIAVFALLIVLFFFARSSTRGIVLYYGIGCPHCAKVEEFMTQNKVEEKVPLTKKEVYYNQRNARELSSRAKACGMSSDNVGVPFLWTGSGCLVGDGDIISFFQSKL